MPCSAQFCSAEPPSSVLCYLRRAWGRRESNSTILHRGLHKVPVHVTATRAMVETLQEEGAVITLTVSNMSISMCLCVQAQPTWGKEAAVWLCCIVSIKCDQGRVFSKLIPKNKQLFLLHCLRWKSNHTIFVWCLLSSLKWLVMLTHKDEMAKSHPERQQLIFMSLSLHVTICITRSPSGSVCLSSHLHGHLIPLSTDTAIINHRKEYSRSRLHTAVGRLPACLPVLHSWTSDSNRDFTLIQEHHAQKSKPGWLQHTSSFCPHRSSPNLSNQLARTWWPGSKPTVMSGW